MKKENIILLSLLSLGFIFLNLILIKAADPFGITNNMDPDLLEFIVSFIPVAIIFVISFIFVKTGKRGMIALQSIMWWLFAFYSAVKVGAWASVYFNLNIFSQSMVDLLIKIPTQDSYYPWFLISLFLNLAIGLALSFKNSTIMKIARK